MLLLLLLPVLAVAVKSPGHGILLAANPQAYSIVKVQYVGTVLYWEKPDPTEEQTPNPILLAYKTGKYNSHLQHKVSLGGVGNLSNVLFGFLCFFFFLVSLPFAFHSSAVVLLVPMGIFAVGRHGHILPRTIVGGEQKEGDRSRTACM